MDRSIDGILAGCPLFSGLQPSQRYVLAQMAMRRNYPAGTMIFRQDEPCPGLFVIDRGQVRVFRVSPSGQEHVLHLCGPGQTFAEIASIGDFPLPACAQAAEPTDCLLIPHDRLNRQLAENHELCRQLLVGMAFWVRHLVQLLEDVVLRDATGRVARYLLDLPMADGLSIELPAAKKDVASHLNLTSETFSRVLRQLGDMKVLTSDSSRTLHLLNRAVLQTLAHS